jgi:hypothetical protein
MAFCLARLDVRFFKINFCYSQACMHLIVLLYHFFLFFVLSSILLFFKFASAGSYDEGVTVMVNGLVAAFKCTILEFK